MQSAANNNNVSLSSQLDQILQKQSEILQISADSYMPGALNTTQVPSTKSLSFTPTKSTNALGTVCKDKKTKESADESLNLQQIFSKLQVSVQQSMDGNKSLNGDDDTKVNEEDKSMSMRRIWVKSLVLATHFVTAVWLTLKEDIECNQSHQTPK